MILTTLSSPICVFDINEFGVCTERYPSKIKDVFYDLEWDYYLLRQRQIEFLQQNLPTKTVAKIDAEIWSRYYVGELEQSVIDHWVNELPATLQADYQAIRPTRRRAVAEFNLQRTSDGWHSERTPANAFCQGEALIEDEAQQDFRHARRVFNELDGDCIDNEFYQILHGIAGLLTEKHPTPIQRLNTVVHFTQVTTSTTNVGTNSPEGIHQDGMDYIVSALVVERRNISGGKSIVFGGDKQTRLFETVLKPGQGLFQADKNTDLWHVVEPVHVTDEIESLGVRSTIGFDFTVLQ